MKIPEPYRGVEYSVTPDGNGKWRWKLHPKMQHGVMAEIVSGEADSQDAAIDAARAGINRMLGPETA